MKLSKKGVMKAGILVLLVVMLLFFVVNGMFGLAETSEEEKARIEVELSQLEQQLSVISAGLGQDFGGLLCGVDKIKYNNFNCDNLTAFHIVKVLTVGVHNQRFNFSDFIADAHNLASLANVSTNGSVNRFIDDSDTDFVFDGNGNYYLLLKIENGKCGLIMVNVNENCNEINDEIMRIKLRIEEIKSQLKKFEN